MSDSKAEEGHRQHGTKAYPLLFESPYLGYYISPLAHTSWPRYLGQAL